MPPSLAQHPDIMWVVIIGLINLIGAIGTGLILVVSFSTKRELKHATENQQELKKGQIFMSEKLDKSIERIHDRIDNVKRDVDEKINEVHEQVAELKGEHNVFHRLIEKVDK